ncbi:capsule assembly Wzi family protein [Salegentibacter flavus]|nr:capsule assembly Wzi family protein [Salegentibacter flavus]
MKKHHLIYILFFTFSFQVNAQWTFSGNLETKGIVTSDEESPFWLYTNQKGRLDKGTNFLGLFGSTADYSWKKQNNISFGGSIAYSDRNSDEFFIDEAYALFQHNWLEILVGKKHNQVLYDGMSVSNENILWSLNAPALPGIRIKTLKPIFFNENEIFGFEALWSDYLLEKDRFVSKARLHRKSLHFIYKPNQTWRLKFGIQHFAQWGGNSPVHGEQPTGFKDYIRIISGRGGGENASLGEQINSLGNHLGSYELYIDKKFKNFKVQFIYNSIFEDGSGSRLANFPDGRYGVFLDFDNKGWINSFLYEFYYSKNQSQTRPHLWDDYFNNYIYASGYTYKNQVIGLPFFTTNYYENYPRNSNTTRIGNNLITAHHFGISGFVFKQRPYKFLLSFRNNHGHNVNTGVADYEYFSSNDPRGEIKLSRNVISTYFEINLIDSFLKLDAFIGADYSKSDKNLGGGVNLKKDIF